jgi:hypothetical protein
MDLVLFIAKKEDVFFQAKGEEQLYLLESSVQKV